MSNFNKALHKEVLKMMKDAGQFCSNCDYFRKFSNAYPAKCCRHPDGYSPVTGTSKMDYYSDRRCSDIVGTKECEWKAANNE